MRELKYSEILSKNRALGASLSGRVFRIILLSNIVVSQLKEILEFSLRDRGINAEVTLGEYDNIVQEAAHARDFDAVVVFWEAANLVDGLHVTADAKDQEELERLAGRVEGEMGLVLDSLRHVPLVLFNRFSARMFDSHELQDGALGQLCARLNATLEIRLSANQLPVDLDRVINMVGLDAAADHRQFLTSKALYSIDFLKAYAEHVVPAFRAVTGHSRKVLVLDCDNTLWGGVLGEDGEDEIRMNEATREGKAFREVQFILKGFRRKGILLSLCSKNNPGEVERVLADHPDMVLRGADFTALKVNWQDKASNLRDLARELNLGLDSFVFVDDSEFELGLVTKELPQVRCVRVPKQLSEYPFVIRRLAGEFFSLAATAEDARKTEMYHEEQARRHEADRFASVEDYLRSLGLTIDIGWNEEIPVARAAQLTQKTNQFNLTTRRYTEGDVSRMLSERTWAFAAFGVKDRYGDYGVTGLLILRITPQSDEALIDTFLMSCRILGRNVEYAFFDHLIGKLKSQGVTQLHGEYLRTDKNEQVAGFYDGLGFIRQVESEDRRHYLLELNHYRPSGIDYIKANEDAG